MGVILTLAWWRPNGRGGEISSLSFSAVLSGDARTGEASRRCLRRPVGLAYHDTEQPSVTCCRTPGWVDA